MSVKGVINSYDIDGVIYMGPHFSGLIPGPRDVIITGRSFEERPETFRFLDSIGIVSNKVFFNPKRFDEKTRHSSGLHKASVLRKLLNEGIRIGIHFEDDPVQADVIRERVKEVEIVLIVHDLVDKENRRHDY